MNLVPNTLFQIFLQPDSFSNYSSSNGPVIHDITDLQENNQRQNSGAKKDSAVLDLSHLNLPSDIITPVCSIALSIELLENKITQVSIVFSVVFSLWGICPPLIAIETLQLEHIDIPHLLSWNSSGVIRVTVLYLKSNNSNLYTIN